MLKNRMAEAQGRKAQAFVDASNKVRPDRRGKRDSGENTWAAGLLPAFGVRGARDYRAHLAVTVLPGLGQVVPHGSSGCTWDGMDKNEPNVKKFQQNIRKK